MQEKYWIEEKEYVNDTIINNVSLNINSFNKTIKTVVIFLTSNDEYIGHISANIYSDNTACLSMSGIRNFELPDELNKYRDYILKHDVALLVNEKYQRMGYATKLINKMLEYLSELGINDLKVSSISDESALKCYLNTGAELIDDKNAIYRNIKNIIGEKRR